MSPPAPTKMRFRGRSVEFAALAVVLLHDIHGRSGLGYIGSPTRYIQCNSITIVYCGYRAFTISATAVPETGGNVF